MKPTDTIGDDVTLYRGDCLAVLPTLAPDSVDVVITDPPYNVGKNYGEHDDSMPRDAYLDWLGKVLAECRRVSRDGVIYTPGTANVFDVPQVLAAAGLRPHRMLGWHRREFAGDLWRGGPAICWEPVVWATKVESPFYNRIFGHWGRDFLAVDCVRMDPMRKVHPCPKPPEVMKWLNGLFCRSPGLVLDPFMGTGTVGDEAMKSGRGFIGIELDPTHYATSLRRLTYATGNGPGQLFAGLTENAI